MSVVAPEPLMMSMTFSPGWMPISFTSAFTMMAAVSSADFMGWRPPPSSPCWPMPISISSSPTSARSVPVCGCVAPRTATASVAMLSAKRCATAATSSRLMPSAAAAPAILYVGMQPTRPRRSSAFSRGAFDTSSCVTTLTTFRPCFLHCFMVMLPVSMSPAWLSTM